MTEEKTSPLTEDQFAELFGEEARRMTPEQARRQLCQHHDVAAMDHEIDALNDLARKLGVGFEQVLVQAKVLIEAMEYPSASAIPDLLAPGPGKKGTAEARSVLEKAIRKKVLEAQIAGKAGALTRSGPVGRRARRATRRRRP